MGFFNIPDAPVQRNYSRWGYRDNPFPVKGQVVADIHFEREELEGLKQALNSFLFQQGHGALYAIEGRRGVGKSNLLQFINKSLEELSSGRVVNVAWHYAQSQLMGPQYIVSALMSAIGKPRLVSLLKNISSHEGQQLGQSFKGTDLYRFVQSCSNLLEDEEHDVAADFLVRWLSGYVTYVDERKKYNIWSRSKLTPAVSISFVKGLVDMLVSFGLLEVIVLMLDEAEDLTLNPKMSTTHAMVLKTLFNSFNRKRLFVILAGQVDSMSKLGMSHASLLDRWTVVKMAHLKTPEEAVGLAKAYMEHYRRDDFKAELRPSDTEIKYIYERIEGVKTQRALLDALHHFVDEHINQVERVD